MTSSRTKGKEGAPAGAVWTVGYEGNHIDEFVDKLRGAGIERLLDVRRVAWSHKPGFRKETLRAAMESAGIDYVHMPELGTPKDVQAKYKAGGPREEFMASYRQHLKGEKEALQEALRLAQERHTVLMCFEADPADCHRSALADELGKSGLQRIDL
jgi:uncharacterized protein (DUF488 family)